MGYIYKITNTVNNKVYIGQTRYTIEWRWKTHLYATFTNTACDHNSLLHKSLRKYGIDSFKVEELEFCETIDLLNEREKYWVAYYNSADINFGYNISKGGGGYTVYTDELNDILLNYWNEGFSVKEISNKLPEVSSNTILNRLKGLGISKDEIRLRKNSRISEMNSKMVYQYSLDGTFLKSYISATVASKELKTGLSNINACANGALKSAGGYRWSYIKVDKLSNTYIKRSGFTLVGKYDNDGNLLEAYTSLSSAAINNNLCRKSLSIHCESGLSYKGYFWKFLDIDNGIIHFK